MPRYPCSAKTKVVKTIHRHPWFDDKIRAEVKLGRQKERRWNKDPTEYNYMAFYYQRRHVENTTRTTQRNYYHKLLEESKITLRPYAVLQINFFSGMIASHPPTTSVQKLADGFIDFFTEKIDKIMLNLIPTHPNQTDEKYI